MPRLPGEINRAIGESNPDEKWQGEEGIAQRIELNDEHYFAKQWRGKHYEGERAGLSVSYEEAGEQTPVSPFWHKVKFYESKLIHEAFPKQTLEMAVAYDPRIAPDGSTFTPGAGRPVTVTREVVGDAAVRDERDQIIREAYDKVWRSREPDDVGVMRSKGGTGAFFAADRAMIDRFGPEMTPIPSHGRDVREILEQNISHVQGWSPKSDLLALLEAGLIPIHTGVNFIPTAESDSERGPQGVYLELAVADVERLRKKLYEPCGVDAYCRAQIDRRIERYLMYRVLDDCYDDLFSAQHQMHDLRDRAVADHAFTMLRALQDRLERDGVRASGSWLPVLRKRLERCSYLFPAEEIIAELDRIRAMLEEGSDVVERKAA